MNSDDAPLEAVVGLLLAAGRSRRFGSDKRLARLENGQTLLAHSLAQARLAFARVLVVLRPGEGARDLGLPADTWVAPAPRSHQGMGASLADGVAALHDTPCEALAVLLGDMPWIEPAVMRELGRQASATRIVQPVHGASPGHPVFFGHRYFAELQRLDGDSGARELLVRHSAQCLRIAVDTPAIHQDVDLADQL